MRQRHANGLEEMVFQTEADVENTTNGLVKVAATAVTFTFHAPRRSCRINIQSSADLTKENITQTHKETEQTIDLHNGTSISWIIVVFLAFLTVSISSGICMICQFEYHRKKYQAWKSLPSSGYSTPTKQFSQKLGPVDTSTEDLISPTLRDAKRQMLKRASKLIRVHLRTSRKLAMRRSLSEAHVIDSSHPMIPLIPNRHITGDLVKKALKTKSKRYRQGYYKPLNKPMVPSCTPLMAKRRSRSLDEIADLLSLEALPRKTSNHDDVSEAVTAVTNTLSGSEASRSMQFQTRRRRRLLSKAAQERIMERRQKRLLMLQKSISNDSLTTLKATGSVSEFSVYSQQSGDPELEFDLYDCDLNNVSALPGSMFAPTVFVDLTGDEDDEEFEMTELFPMLRAGADQNPRKTSGKTMVDSVTSDLAISITSEDLKYATLGRKTSGLDSDDETMTLCAETDNLLTKKPSGAFNLTHIEDEVSFVDE